MSNSIILGSYGEEKIKLYFLFQVDLVHKSNWKLLNKDVRERKLCLGREFFFCLEWEKLLPKNIKIDHLSKIQKFINVSHFSLFQDYL